MTKPKEVAKTLKTVLNKDVSEEIMNRGSDISQAIDEVLNFWSFDLYSRKPGPAYIDGTDLDMVAFLFSLIDRGAIINIPDYKSMRASKIKEDQHLISNSNRHGKIIGVTANKNTFSFSIRIFDMNIMGQKNGQDYIGDYRNFSLTDFYGNWYDGWKKINFLPSADENKFLTENEQWDPLKDNTISFNNFVHPNRWTSYYGQYYFLTKMLIDRITEQSKNYYSQIKRMLDNGIKFPPSGEATQEGDDSSKQTKVDKGKKVKINSFQTEVDVPDNDSEYPVFEDNEKNLVELYRKRNYLTYNINPKLRFITRATELAFFNNGFDKDGNERFPAWLRNVKWERDHKVSTKSRTKWDRLVLFQPGVAEKGVSIRKRTYEKSEEISSKEE